MKKKHGASFSRPDELARMIAGARGHGRALPLAGARPARGGHGPSQMQAQWLARVTAAASDASRERRGVVHRRSVATRHRRGAARLPMRGGVVVGMGG